MNRAALLLAVAALQLDTEAVAKVQKAFQSRP
jgi:hypothetical protein